MPIHELIEQQRMGRKLGELRFGTTATSKAGKTIPVRLEYWRLTSRSESAAKSAAGYFGVDYRKVTLNNKEETFEVLSKIDRLPVIIPPGEAAISQWLEKWTGGGCERRCDGITEQKTQSPCKCPSDIAERVELAKKGKACKPMTRVNVMLPYISGIGTWLVKSTGFNAAVEFGGDTQLLAAAAAQGVNLPASLWLDKRTEVKNGETMKYVVPVLDVEKTLHEIVAISSGAGGSLAEALGTTPPPLAIAANSTGTSTVTASVRLSEDEVIEAELVEDHEPAPAVTSASASASPPPTSANAVQVKPPTAQPAVRPTLHVPEEDGETASNEALSDLQIQRASAGLTGGPWAKFVAMTLGRSVAANETKFSIREVAVLTDALDSYEARG